MSDPIDNQILFLIDYCLVAFRCPTLDQGERLDRLPWLQVQHQRGAVVHHRETLYSKHMTSQ